MSKPQRRPLRKLSAADTRRLADEAQTVFVTELQPGFRLYRLADGTGLLTLPDFVSTDDPAFEHGVKMVVGAGELWKSPEAMLASLTQAPPPRSYGPFNPLKGLFDAPDLVTTGLEEQRRYLDRELGLAESPALTLEGLGEYDAALPRRLDDYDPPLIRAVACVLSEAVRAAIGGVFEIERKSLGPATVWEPWIRIPGGDRLIPAGHYVSTLDEGEIPSLQIIHLSNVSLAMQPPRRVRPD